MLGLSVSSRERISIAMTNKKPEMGSPCLVPEEMRKDNSEGAEFIRMEAKALVTIADTALRNQNGKFI